MSCKEMARLRLMHQVEAGTITLRQASEEMGVSERQAKRIWRRFRRDGEAGLVHAGRGRVSNRRMPAGRRREILALYEAHCAGYGPTLASEVLAEEHGVAVHRETLRRFLLAEHLAVPRSQARAHRKRRPRREHFGSLVQIDGSFHRWLGGEAMQCLMVAVDDATGRMLLWMCEEETTRDAFMILRKWIERYGIPEAIYVDRRSVYVVDREATAEEKAQGSGPLTDFGRACWRLGIRVIAAHSPQAKGRVERRNGVLQDRLVKALARRGAGSIAQANAALEELAQDFDRRFALAPASPIDRHGKRPVAAVLDETLCWEKTRTVANDWTVSCYGSRWQILRQEGAPGRRKKVTVRRGMDGAVSVHFQGRKLRIEEGAGSSINQSVIAPPMGGGGACVPGSSSAFPP